MNKKLKPGYYWVKLKRNPFVWQQFMGMNGYDNWMPAHFNGKTWQLLGMTYVYYSAELIISPERFPEPKSKK